MSWIESCFIVSQGFRHGSGTDVFCRRLRGAYRFHQLGEVFPEEFAAIDDLSSAHVEQVYRESAIFEVIAKDVGIVALLRGGDPLLLLQLMHCGELIAEAGSRLELLGLSRGHHARGE